MASGGSGGGGSAAAAVVEDGVSLWARLTRDGGSRCMYGGRPSSGAETGAASVGRCSEGKGESPS